MKRILPTLTLILLPLCLNEVLGQSVPKLINYQGQLLDAAGNPMPTGDYSVEVRLYDVPSGGAAVWGPQIFNGQSGTGFAPKIAVVQGRFNVVVGPQDTSARELTPAFSASSNIFIEIKVGTANPITPRQQILTAPYALASENSAQLQSFGWDSVFTDTGRPDTGHLPGSKIADLAITTAKIADAAITVPKLNLQTGLVAIGQASANYQLDVATARPQAAIRAVNSANGVHAVYLAESGDAMYAVGNVIIQGNLNVQGTLSKTAGAFKIDHPLDPANKYLSHSFVESPDMKNIYDGVVVLDEGGTAQVELPNWFEALNQEFRYQLTSIGGPAPNLYVAEEISGHRFRIAGGSAGAKVSWQVTGTRHDAYANAHRIRVEETKDVADRGRYLSPELFGADPDRTIRSSPATTTADPLKAALLKPRHPTECPNENLL